MKWVSAFSRPGQEVAFTQLGDMKKAQVVDGVAVWNVVDQDLVYRVVAKGALGKASFITLLGIKMPEGK